jgi:hypothetical protein
VPYIHRPCRGRRPRQASRSSCGEDAAQAAGTYSIFSMESASPWWAPQDDRTSVRPLEMLAESLEVVSCRLTLRNFLIFSTEPHFDTIPRLCTSCSKHSLFSWAIKSLHTAPRAYRLTKPIRRHPDKDLLQRSTSFAPTLAIIFRSSPNRWLVTRPYNPPTSASFSAFPPNAAPCYKQPEPYSAQRAPIAARSHPAETPAH